MTRLQNGIAADSITPQEQQLGQLLHSLELLIEEFFKTSSPSEQQVCTLGRNSKVEYTYGWYSTSAGIK
jgi:hypothetical protein